jgi:IS30 family transposase
LPEREILYAQLEKGLSLRAISCLLRRSHSTLSRELRRNKRPNGTYFPCIAEVYAKERLQRQHKQAALKSKVIYVYVEEHIKMKWSPEQIVGRLRLEAPSLRLCHETIYRFIYHPAQKDKRLWEYLTHARTRRMVKGGRRVYLRLARAFFGAPSIEKRPDAVFKRDVVGHWETDNLIGKISDKAAISTTVERKTRYTILTKLADKSAQEKYFALVSRLREFPGQMRRTLTTDNGSENMKYAQISRDLEVSMFFCHAYASWEKGSVENMNKRIRRFIPKGTSIDALTKDQVAETEYYLNNTPRKCLGYKTPEETLQEALLHIPLSRQEQQPQGYLFAEGA